MVFPNLSGDAWLVVPRALVEDEHYAHLARFVRGAPHVQVAEFLRTMGQTIVRWWSERAEPLWVSTSGLGVHWLHVRLDTRPKYYSYEPYRTQKVRAAQALPLSLRSAAWWHAQQVTVVLRKGSLPEGAGSVLGEHALW